MITDACLCIVGCSVNGECPVHGDGGHLPTRQGDWERGYAKGYDRALQQLMELVDFNLPSKTLVELVRELAEKLRKEALEP